MGSVGTNTSISTKERLAGKSITELNKYLDWKEGKNNLRKDFDLDFATNAQIVSIQQLFRSMQEYDTGYDAEHTPYNIIDIDIKRVGKEYTEEDRQRDRELFGRTFENKDISVSIRTEPVTDNAYIRMMDEKYRYALLGSRGGWYTYNNKSNRVQVKTFDLHYGKRGI